MAKLPPAPPPSTHAASIAMKGNRRSGTRPELAVRRAIHAAGLRYKVDAPVLLAAGRKVRPDLVFGRRRICVFVDGCFWHGCPDHCRVPSGNRSYWKAKLESNKERDQRTTEALLAGGWTVIRAWEHENAQAVADRVIAIVRASPVAVRPPRGDLTATEITG